MKRRDKACKVLAAAGTQEGLRSIRTLLHTFQGQEELTVLQAQTISQVRQALSPYNGPEPAELLIIKFPLKEDAGIEQILEMAGNNSRLQMLLMVRRDLYDQISYRCRAYNILVLALPAQVPVVTETVGYMLKMRRQLAQKDDEVLRLRKKLSEIGLITRAKCILIREKDMTEEEAHYYLEKQAMDNGLPKKEAALEIIREFEADTGGLGL